MEREEREGERQRATTVTGERRIRRKTGRKTGRHEGQTEGGTVERLRAEATE